MPHSVSFILYGKICAIDVTNFLAGQLNLVPKVHPQCDNFSIEFSCEWGLNLGIRGSRQA